MTTNFTLPHLPTPYITASHVEGSKIIFNLIGTQEEGLELEKQLSVQFQDNASVQILPAEAFSDRHNINLTVDRENTPPANILQALYSTSIKNLNLTSLFLALSEKPPETGTSAAAVNSGGPSGQPTLPSAQAAIP